MTEVQTFYLFYIGTPLVISAVALGGLWLYERANPEGKHPAE